MNQTLIKQQLARVHSEVRAASRDVDPTWVEHFKGFDLSDLHLRQEVFNELARRKTYVTYPLHPLPAKAQAFLEGLGRPPTPAEEEVLGESLATTFALPERFFIVFSGNVAHVGRELTPEEERHDRLVQRGKAKPAHSREEGAPATVFDWLDLKHEAAVWSHAVKAAGSIEQTP
jgi:hypothetical protein